MQPRSLPMYRYTSTRVPIYINEVLLCQFVRRKISTLTFGTNHIHIFIVLYCFLENPQIHLIYHYEFNEPQFGKLTECGRTVTFMLKRSFLWSLVCNVLNIQGVFIYCKYVICKKHKCLYMYVYIYIYTCV